MKTVSWYLHSFQMVIDDLIIITPDREYQHISFGRALNQYGDLRVSTAVISAGLVTLILSAGNGSEVISYV